MKNKIQAIEIGISNSLVSDVLEISVGICCRIIAGRDIHMTNEFKAAGVEAGKRLDFFKRKPSPSETKISRKLFITLKYS
tara:strand:- start:8047 stop:8286 length:240 start_codon:yes stop_codon:yes gene_type:complete